MKETISEGENRHQDNLNEMLVDLTIDFLEAFVENAAKMDEASKALLGDIVRKMLACKKEEGTLDVETLDAFFESKREEVTKGAFLRHLEGEVARVVKAPKITPESAHMVQVLRMIQSRAVEEMAEKVGGDAAKLLNQLVQYEDEGEREAVLISDLSARGLGFAGNVLNLIEAAEADFKLLIEEGRDDIDQTLLQRLEVVKDITKKWTLKWTDSGSIHCQ